jgi:hypothetical protein
VNTSLDLLHSSDVSVTLRDGNNHQTMLTMTNSQTFLAEAAPSASNLPCRHEIVAKRRFGTRALAGGRAR